MTLDEEIEDFLYRVGELGVLSKLNISEEARELADEARSLWLKKQKEKEEK
jgi:hypothetical protein